MHGKLRFCKVLALVLCLICLLGVAAFANAIGDIDNDGEIKAGDARLVLRAAVGLENLTDAQKSAADVDGDGEIKAGDARLVLRAAVGLETLTDKREKTCAHIYLYVTEKNDSGQSTGRHYRKCSRCGNVVDLENCTYNTASTPRATCVSGVSYTLSCTVCDGKKTFRKSKLDHNWQPTANKGEDWQEYQCTSCRALTIKYNTTPASVLEFFNTHVNELKNGTYQLSGFRIRQTDTQMDAEKTKLVFSNSMKTIFTLLGDGWTEESFMQGLVGSAGSVETTELITGVPTTITKNNMQIKGSDKVSNLTLDDLQQNTCTKEIIDGIDFLSEFASGVEVAYGSGTMKYDLSQYQTDKKVIKITAKLKDEKYAEVKDLPGETALQHIADVKLKECGNITPESFGLGNMGDGIDVDSSVTCEDAYTKATVTYYFDVDTYQPIAAVYDVTLATDYYITFNFNLDFGDTDDDLAKWLKLLGKDWGKNIISGTMDIANETHTVDYVFFSK